MTASLQQYADVLRAWLAEGRSLRLPITGDSMRPTIESGACIRLTACDPSALRLADIVLYDDAERLVCHRVIGRQGRSGDERILTGGDGVRLPATWIPASAVVGRVVAVEREGRTRSLDGRAERLRALAVTARSWVRLHARHLVRTMRGMTRRRRLA